MEVDYTEKNGWQDWAEVMLNALPDGVLVCEADGRVLLMNRSARQFFGNRPTIDPDHSLSDFFSRDSVEQALAILRRQQNSAAATAKGLQEIICVLSLDGMLVSCRFVLLPPAARCGEFVMFFTTALRKDDSEGFHANMFCAAVEGLRSPLANLRAAAENLVTHPDMAPVMRSAFENVIAQESVALSEQFEELAGQCRSQVLKQSLLVHIYSRDLIGSLRRRLTEKNTVSLRENGAPQWLQIDSLLLLPCLVYFIDRITALFSVSEIEVETTQHGAHVYLDFIWTGPPVPAVEIESWRACPITGEELTHITVAEVLRRQNSDVWSSARERPGYSMVRIPLPSSPRGEYSSEGES